MAEEVLSSFCMRATITMTYPNTKQPSNGSTGS